MILNKLNKKLVNIDNQIRIFQSVSNSSLKKQDILSLLENDKTADGREKITILSYKDELNGEISALRQYRIKQQDVLLKLQNSIKDTYGKYW